MAVAPPLAGFWRPGPWPPSGAALGQQLLARLRLLVAPRWWPLIGAALVAGLGVLGGVGVHAATAKPAAAARAEALVPAAIHSVATSVAGPAPSGGLVVHVAGAVARPGLYELAGNARVADAVSAAGGLRPDADLTQVNLAAPVADGVRVWIPAAGEAPPGEAPVVEPSGGARRSGQPGPAGGGAGPVDLNRATAADLDALAGIGPATAAAIVRFRDEHGRFTTVEDLLAVPGIGPAKLENLRSHVRV